MQYDYNLEVGKYFSMIFFEEYDKKELLQK
jgi:hypothetical protein